MLRYTTAEEWRTWRTHCLGPLRFLRSSPFTAQPLGLFAERATAAVDRPVVVAIDDLSPTRVAALMRPARLLVDGRVPIVVLAPIDLASALTRFGFSLLGPAAPSSHSTTILGPVIRELSAVLASTHCAGSGAVAWEAARESRVPFLVVQHGVITPFSPPLAPDARVFAWSSDDANFWRAGRDDLDVTVVGSELLWGAARTKPIAEPDRSGATLFLGQLHATELPRRMTLQTVAQIARCGPVIYRPHPGESDLLSRAGHALIRARGMEFVSSSRPIAAGTGPIVGIFSTGILEAAAAGRRAFAHCVDPPLWVESLWQRYGMARLGQTEATRVETLDREPASVIAEIAGNLR